MLQIILVAAAACVIIGGFAYSYWAQGHGRWEVTAHPSPRRISLLTEAMGYAGAVLVIAGVAAAIDQRWDAVSDWSHVAVDADTAALFLAMGVLLLPVHDAAIQRLIGVVWLASAVGLGAAIAFAAHDVYDLSGHGAVIATGLGTAAYAMVLWLARPAALQNLALFAALAMTVGGVVAVYAGDEPPMPYALALWALGVGWAVAGGLAAKGPYRADVPFGAILLLLAPSMALHDDGWMYAIAIGSAAAVMALSLATRSTPLLVLGTLFTFGYVTSAVLRYFSDSLGAPATLATTGLVIIGLTVTCAWLIRRMRSHPAAAVAPGGSPAAEAGRAELTKTP